MDEGIAVASIQEALTHIKEWISQKDYPKAIQGLKELLEFSPDNTEAQELYNSIKGMENSMVVAVPAPEQTISLETPALIVSAPTEEPAPAIEVLPEPSTPPAEILPEPAPSVEPPELSQKAKISILSACLIILTATGYFAYPVLFSGMLGNQPNKTEEIQVTLPYEEVQKQIEEIPEISPETPQPEQVKNPVSHTIQPEKVRRK